MGSVISLFLRLSACKVLFQHKESDLNNIPVLESGLAYLSTGSLSSIIITSFLRISLVPLNLLGKVLSDRHRGSERKRKGERWVLCGTLLPARIFTVALGTLTQDLGVGEGSGNMEKIDQKGTVVTCRSKYSSSSLEMKSGT